MPDETDEQILARYRERWRDPFLTMSAALDLDNTRRRFANLGALKRKKGKRRKCRQVGAHPAHDFPRGLR